MDFGEASPPPPPMPQTAPVVVSPVSPDCAVKPFEFKVVDMLARISFQESIEIIRTKVTEQGPKGVRMATPAEINEIIKNNTDTKLTGDYIGTQWVASESPYHDQEYVNIGDASEEFKLGSRYIRQTGSFPKWGSVAGIEQGSPVQAGEHAKNTHILFVVDCTVTEPAAVVGPLYDVISVRGEKQW